MSSSAPGDGRSQKTVVLTGRKVLQQAAFQETLVEQVAAEKTFAI
jgi:hypothetical protein